MKCPKCGFTSFDDLQDCKKCGNDLSAFQSKFNLRSLLRPVAAAPATTSDSEEFPQGIESTTAAGDATDFGYDFMEETTAEPVSSLDDLLDPETPAQTTMEGFDFESQFQEDTEEISFSEDRPDAAPLDLETDFNWDDSEEISEEAKGEMKGFDLPSLEELPSLEDFGDSIDEETAGLPDFPDFDDLEEDPPKAERKHRDPFDARGSAEAWRPPASRISDAHEAPLPAPETWDDLESGAEERPTSALAAPIALRLRAGIVDTTILVLAFALFLAAGEMILQGGIVPSTASLSELIIPYFLIFFFLCFGYFTLFHSLTGQTVGKMLFGLRVEGVGGAPVLFSQAFLRAAGGVLCLLPFGLGFLQILRAPEGRGINDRLGGTWVVRVQGEEEEEIESEEYVEA